MHFNRARIALKGRGSVLHARKVRFIPFLCQQETADVAVPDPVSEAQVRPSRSGQGKRSNDSHPKLKSLRMYVTISIRNGDVNKGIH